MEYESIRRRIAQTDEENSFVWNVAEADIEPGTYFLYATIEDRSQRILFDYSDGYLVVPEPGSRFFYGFHLLEDDGLVSSFDTTQDRTFTGVDFDFNPAVNMEAGPDGKILLAVDSSGTVRAASKGQVVDTMVQEDLLGYETRAYGLSLVPDLPFGDRKIIDLEFDISGNGYYLLDSHGELYASKGVVDPLSTPGLLGLFGIDIARDFEITRSARGGYILTGDGGVVPLGDAPVISHSLFWVGYCTGSGSGFRRLLSARRYGRSLFGWRRGSLVQFPLFRL